MRESFQEGQLIQEGNVWRIRYRETTLDGKRKRPSVRLGTLEEYPTRAKARRAMQERMKEVNESLVVTRFGDLADQFVKRGMPDRAISKSGYMSYLNKFRSAPWGKERLDYLASAAGIAVMEEWFKGLTSTRGTTKGRPLAAKSKKVIKAVLHVMFECAMKWGYLGLTVKNPAELVSIKLKRGEKSGKRKRIILTVAQYHALMEDQELPEHVKVMVRIDAYTGFRRSEILGLKWGDLDFKNLIIHLRRGWVEGEVNDLKTEGSAGAYPMHPDLAVILKAWKLKASAVQEGWVFGNLSTGKPFRGSSLQQDYLVPAGERIGIHKTAEVIGLGFHHFRHFRRHQARKLSPEEQKKIMRHANIATTMDIYGNDDDAKAEEIRNQNTVLGDQLRMVG